jgi:hypothetical protein
MRRAKSNSNVLSFIVKPLCIIVLLLGLFELIWLRSNIVTVAYDLRNLEEQKMDALKDMKLLLADRAKLMSLEKIDASLKADGNRGKEKYNTEYVFPDRIKVVHIKQEKGPKPFRVSLSARGTD